MNVACPSCSFQRGPTEELQVSEDVVILSSLDVHRGWNRALDSVLVTTETVLNGH